jgi:hypothetical protein
MLGTTPGGKPEATLALGAGEVGAGFAGAARFRASGIGSRVM